MPAILPDKSTLFLYRTTLRVRYVETDRMGVVWHGNYFQYFEVARAELMSACGLGSYADLEASGIMMPVVKAVINYHKGATYDDLLTIETTVPETPKVTMTFVYRILNAAGELLVDGSTTLAFIHATTKKPCRAPLFLRKAFSHE